MKLYYPTSSNNLIRLMVDEMICPPGIYKKLSFAATGPSTTILNPLTNRSVFYTNFPGFRTDPNREQGFPIVFELDLPDPEKFGIIQATQDCYFCDTAVPLTPATTKILFQTKEQIKSSLVKLESIQRAKGKDIFRKCLFESHRSEVFHGSICPINDDPEIVREEIIRQVSEYDRVKGLYFGYIIGTFESLSDHAELLRNKVFALKNYYSELNLITESEPSAAMQERALSLIAKTDDALWKCTKLAQDWKLCCKYLDDAPQIMHSYLQSKNIGKPTLLSYFEQTLNFRRPPVSSSKEAAKSVAKTASLKNFLEKYIESTEIFLEETIDREKTDPLKQNNGLLPAMPEYMSDLKEALSNEIAEAQKIYLQKPTISTEVFDPLACSKRKDVAKTIGAVIRNHVKNWDTSKHRQIINSLITHLSKFKPLDIPENPPRDIMTVSLLCRKGSLNPQSMEEELERYGGVDTALLFGLWGYIYGYHSFGKQHIENLIKLPTWNQIYYLIEQELNKLPTVKPVRVMTSQSPASVDTSKNTKTEVQPAEEIGKICKEASNQPVSKNKAIFNEHTNNINLNKASAVSEISSRESSTETIDGKIQLCKTESEEKTASKLSSAVPADILSDAIPVIEQTQVPTVSSNSVTDEGLTLEKKLQNNTNTSNKPFAVNIGESIESPTITDHVKTSSDSEDATPETQTIEIKDPVGSTESENETVSEVNHITQTVNASETEARNVLSDRNDAASDRVNGCNDEFAFTVTNASLSAVEANLRSESKTQTTSESALHASDQTRITTKEIPEKDTTPSLFGDDSFDQAKDNNNTEPKENSTDENKEHSTVVSNSGNLLAAESAGRSNNKQNRDITKITSYESAQTDKDIKEDFDTVAEEHSNNEQTERIPTIEEFITEFGKVIRSAAESRPAYKRTYESAIKEFNKLIQQEKNLSVDSVTKIIKNVVKTMEGKPGFKRKLIIEKTEKVFMSGLKTLVDKLKENRNE